MAYVQDVCSIAAGFSLKLSITVITKTRMNWQTRVKLCTFKGNENPYSRFVVYGQTDMERLTMTFLPTFYSICANKIGMFYYLSWTCKSKLFVLLSDHVCS
jgi:hypothetical protein